MDVDLDTGAEVVVEIGSAENEEKEDEETEPGDEGSELSKKLARKQSRTSWQAGSS